MVRPTFPPLHHRSVIVGGGAHNGGVLRWPRDEIVPVGRTTHALLQRPRCRVAAAAPGGSEVPLPGHFGSFAIAAAIFAIANAARYYYYMCPGQQGMGSAAHLLIPVSAT